MMAANVLRGVLGMTQWKLIGGLALAVFALACGEGGAGPDGGSPVPETPTDLTPTPTQTIVRPTPVACVPVEPEPSTSTISLAEVLPTGKIAFVSFRDEHEDRPNREIYLLTPDSDGPVNLTRNSCADDEPDWSPDGSKIAWSSDRDGDFEIYVMDADGGNVTQLTTEGSALSPRWSPDGERIAYSRGGTIKVMKADGADPVVVLAGDPAAATGEELCQAGGFPGGWSPDSSRILYYAANVGTAIGHVCTVAVEGSDVGAVVTEPPVYNVEPVWSPDGGFIAFRSIREENHDIYVVNLEDGSEQRLTEGDALDIEPEWSPDGEWIAFASSRDGETTDIYVMRADGTDVRRLTDHPEKDSYPVWSP